MSKVMAVAGMHRSATSAVAKGLHLAGFPMAVSEADMIPAMPSNQWGHWEDRHLVALNDAFLSKLGAAWNKPPDVLQVEQQAGFLAHEAEGYIARRVHAHGGGQWGIKDPRLVLLWPVWKLAFEQFPGIDLITVTPWRRAEEVVFSLVRRDNMDPDDATSLTKHYHRLQSHIH